MNRGFYSYSLLSLIALVMVSVTSVVVFTVNSARQQALASANARLVTTHETAMTMLSMRQQLLQESAIGLSVDPGFSAALFSSDVNRFAALLDRHHALSVDSFLVVVAGDGRVRAHNGRRGAIRHIDPQALFASDQPAFKLLDNQAYQITFAPVELGGEAIWVGVGVPLDQSFLKSVQRLTGVDVSVVEAEAGPLASTSVAPVDRAVLLEMPVEYRGANLNFAYTLSDKAAFSEFREFALKIAAVGFGLSALAIFLGALVFGTINARMIVQPIRAIRNGIGRIQQGVYSESVPERGDDDIGRLARAFNQMQSDIAERESRIVHHAEYDALTGLTNRAVVADRLRAICGRAQRNGTTAAAVVIDIERFSDINGSLGNEIGDAVLKEVARRLASNTRATDLLARVGGDEFLIVVEDMEGRLATHISEFLADTLERPIKVNGRSISLRVRVGAALFPVHCDTPEGLRRLANVAKTTAKETGQRVVMYEPGQDERHLRELAVLNDLQTAIAEGQLHLMYQPKIDMTTRNVDQVEALVRWNHPQLGLIPPDEFIGLLEQNNKIHLLTDWVLKTAVQQVQNWASRGFDLRVAVNISANDLLDIELSQRIGTLLHHYLVEPKKISVEVTESAVMQDPQQASRVLHTLRELGIKVAVDDFGTGQTSLSLLKQLPLNELKIDQSFVRNLRADSGDGIIIKSTIDLGHNMGLLVVAEGVESTYAWNLLKSYGCDSVQGYLISKPLTSEKLEAWYLRLQAKHESRLDLSFVDEQGLPVSEKPAKQPAPPERDIVSQILGDVSG